MWPSEVWRRIVWCSVLVAAVVRVDGCFGFVDNEIGAEGCAALARALEGGAVPQLSMLNLGGMKFVVSGLEGLVMCEEIIVCVVESGCGVEVEWCGVECVECVGCTKVGWRGVQGGEGAHCGEAE